MRLFTLAAVSLLIAGTAAAQGGPISVGIPSDPQLKALHCTAAVMSEAYLTTQESKESPFDSGDLLAAGQIWARAGAKVEGKSLDAYMTSPDLAAVTDLKLANDAQRHKQVAWCLANKPS